MSKELHKEQIEELLREYLLEQDAKAPPEESILNQQADKVLGVPPIVTPSPEKEAMMLEKLKDAFQPVPAPAAGSGGSLWSSLKIPALAVLSTVAIITAVLFYTGTSETTSPAETTLTHEGIEDHSIVSDGNKEKGIVQNYAVLPSDTEKTHRSKPDFVFKSGSQNNNEINEPNLMASTGLPDTSESANITIKSTLPGPEPDPVEQPSPLMELFPKTEVATEIFVMKSENETVIFGDQGTLIYIPRDAFRHPDGSKVDGDLRFELKEVYDKSDYVMSNLSTMSNGKPLISGGMICLDAFAEGEKLELAPGKDLYVEFSTDGQRNQQNMQIYAGQYSDVGEMNWIPRGGREYELIPLPIMEINFKQFEASGKEHRSWNNKLKSLYNQKYDNTFIATREFVERVKVAKRFGYATEIIDYYTKNLGKELWEVDLMVAEHMIGDYRNYEHKKLSQLEVEDYNGFARQKLGRVLPYYTYGVDLNRLDAYTALLKNGIEISEADRIMLLRNVRSEILTLINGTPTNSKSKGEKKEAWLMPGMKRIKSGDRGTYVSYSPKRSRGFSVKRMGWTNLDHMFVSPSRVKKFELNVQVDGIENIEETRTYLIYVNQNSVVIAKQIDSETVQFKNVPAGYPASILAVGYKDDKPFIAQKPILMIDSDMEESLAMVETTMENFQSQLRRFDIETGR